ncbi:unnamed protein product, partial [Cyprideis torosa]
MELGTGTAEKHFDIVAETLITQLWGTVYDSVDCVLGTLSTLKMLPEQEIHTRKRSDPEPGRKCSKRSLTLLVTEQRNSIAEPLMATELNRLKNKGRGRMGEKEYSLNGERRASEAGDGLRSVEKLDAFRRKQEASILLKTQHSPRHVLSEGGRGSELLLM